MNYDFCTLRMDGLVEWTFRLFDQDGSGKMSSDEFKTMCKLCLGDDASKPGTKAYDQTMTLMKGLSK
jgi:Ca2+-binding EF-hand superfamily protein